MVKNKKGFKKPNVNKRVETVEKSYDSSLLHTRLPSISYMINRRYRRRRIQTPESSEKLVNFVFWRLIPISQLLLSCQKTLSVNHLFKDSLQQSVNKSRNAEKKANIKAKVAIN